MHENIPPAHLHKSTDCVNRSSFFYPSPIPLSENFYFVPPICPLCKKGKRTLRTQKTRYVFPCAKHWIGDIAQGLNRTGWAYPILLFPSHVTVSHTRVHFLRDGGYERKFRLRKSRMEIGAPGRYVSKQKRLLLIWTGKLHGEERTNGGKLGALFRAWGTRNNGPVLTGKIRLTFSSLLKAAISGVHVFGLHVRGFNDKQQALNFKITKNECF